MTILCLYTSTFIIIFLFIHFRFMVAGVPCPKGLGCQRMGGWNVYLTGTTEYKLHCFWGDDDETGTGKHVAPMACRARIPRDEGKRKVGSNQKGMGCGHWRGLIGTMNSSMRWFITGRRVGHLGLRKKWWSPCERMPLPIGISWGNHMYQDKEEMQVRWNRLEC